MLPGPGKATLQAALDPAAPEIRIPGLSTLLLLDNRDSFVWNLAQAFQTLGQKVTVVRSDQIDSAGIRAAAPSWLVVSPGPGHPAAAGHSVAVIGELSGQVPILGVCLGHQAIATAFGASVVRVPPCHGKPWRIDHSGTHLFQGLPNPMSACRYHSLAIAPDSLPECLQVEATNPEGVIMAVRHRGHPTYGVQFHPESFRTPSGMALLDNFLQASTP